MAKAVFLDRDETLNPDPGYIHDPELFHLYPWVAAELKRLQERGFLLVLITNQSGVGRGRITPSALDLIHQKLNRLLIEQGARAFDLIEVCTHRPEEKCDCRKPKPKLLLDAASKLSLDLSLSYMIGDRESDAEAGRLAGVRQSYLVKPGDEASFKSAIESILKNEAS